jgi:hypothetical protein
VGYRGLDTSPVLTVYLKTGSPFSVSSPDTFLSFSVVILALAGCFSPYSGESDKPEGAEGMRFNFTFKDSGDPEFFVSQGGSGKFLYNPSTVAGQLTGYEIVLKSSGGQEYRTA